MITKTIENGMIKIKAPYNKRFISKIKKNGGKWNSKEEVWEISELALNKVNKILLHCYNTEGEVNEEFLKVKFKAKDFEEDNCIFIDNYIVAYRAGRDRDVTLCDETYLIEGNFSSRGGSTNYPRIAATDDIILVSTINKKLYDNLSDEKKNLLEIIPGVSKREELEKKEQELLKQLEAVRNQMKNL